jgi:hypothetical protein
MITEKNRVLDVYKDKNGDDVDIKLLGDRELVLTLKFFQNYYKSLEKLLNDECVVRDRSYVNYISSIKNIRDSLKYEVQSRKLVMYKFL